MGSSVGPTTLDANSRPASLCSVGERWANATTISYNHVGQTLQVFPTTLGQQYTNTYCSISQRQKFAMGQFVPP